MSLAVAQGPDRGGYRYADSDTTGGPAFQWIDITGQGVRVQLGDDDNQGPFALGFNFDFYGIQYDSVRICSNGWLSFTSESHQYHHYHFPDAHDPNAVIAPLWADLDPAAGGSVYYWADTAQQRFIVSWINVPFYGTADSCTFQAILDTSGVVVFQYLSLPFGTRSRQTRSATRTNARKGRRNQNAEKRKANAEVPDTSDFASQFSDFCFLRASEFSGFLDGLDSCSVGIENAAATIGLEYLYNAEPAGNRLHDSLAVRFYRLQHDVCPTLICRPFDRELTLDVVPPAVRVWNVGRQPATFSVTVKIGAIYQEQMTVSDFAPLRETLLVFRAWIPNGGLSQIEVATGLGSDEFPANDTIRSQTVAAFTGELRADDGQRDTWFLRVGSPSQDWAAGMRFYCPYSPFRLLGARIFVSDTLPFRRIAICPDSQATPWMSRAWFQAESVRSARPDTWLQVNADTTISTDSPIWLVAVWPGRVTGPQIGEDQTAPFDGWAGYGLPRSRWYQYDAGDLLMRVMIDGSSGIAEKNTECGVRNTGLRISPNPVKSAATIYYSLPKAGNVGLKLYDITGKLISTLASGYHNAGALSFVVCRLSFSPGVYLLKLDTENSATTSKLIVE